MKYHMVTIENLVTAEHFLRKLEAADRGTVRGQQRVSLVSWE